MKRFQGCAVLLLAAGITSVGLACPQARGQDPFQPPSALQSPAADAETERAIPRGRQGQRRSPRNLTESSRRTRNGRSS